MMKTVTSREFNQDVSKVKRYTEHGPVFITDRGKPRHVLLSIEDYVKLTGQQKNIIELLAMPEADSIDFEVKPLNVGLLNVKDLS